jgi:hypothetical protein
MVQDQFAGLISSYACASGRDVIQRLRTQFLDLQEPVQRRLLSAIQDLIRVKDALISQCAGLDSLSYPVDGGLGAMCITCVEQHVTSILAEYRFPSEISCRQFWPSFCADEVRRPPIHAYSTVELGGVPLIIDMDADPFVGKSIGVVLAPIDANIPFCHEVPLVLVSRCTRGPRIGSISSSSRVYMTSAFEDRSIGAP